MQIVDSLTQPEIAEIMEGLNKEEIFYCADGTDNIKFAADVVKALRKPLDIRADIFTLVFSDEYDKDCINFITEVIAEVRKQELEEWRAANPDLIDAPNPDNPIKSRWIRAQYESDRVDHKKV